jgi:antitoxin component YwqK of YwqJK toxin-antitoxin module
MKNKILVLLLTLSSTIGFSQIPNKEILYIVDSIPIIEKPEEKLKTLAEDEIDNIVVVKGKKAIKSSPYKDLNLDGIVYVFTKKYAQRPDSIKAIPTTKLMTKRDGTLYLVNSPTSYSGKFINYYLTGKKQGEGVLLNGKLNGKCLLYHINGKVSGEMEYENGISSGLEQKFYKDGTLMQKGNFKNGKKVGTWEMYHPNGQLKQHTNFVNGKMDKESVSYYSTGEIKGKSIYKNGVYQKNKTNDKVFKLYKESQDLYKKVNYKGAIKKLNKALELDPNWAEGYFTRATMKLNNLQFDDAIKDFNKTLKIEPYFTNAYSNRAFTVLRKYELGNGRTVSKSKELQVIVSKETKIPKSELVKICADLKKAISLGDDNWRVLQALEKHCKE